MSPSVAREVRCEDSAEADLLETVFYAHVPSVASAEKESKGCGSVAENTGVEFGEDASG